MHMTYTRAVPHTLTSTDTRCTCIGTFMRVHLLANECVLSIETCVCALRSPEYIRWRFSHLLAKWSVHPSASFCSYTNLNYVDRARGAGEREACAEHEEARQKEKRREKTEAACLLFFSAFLPISSPLARRSEGCTRSEAVREGARRAGCESGLRSVSGWWPHASSGTDHDYARRRYVSSLSCSLWNVSFCSVKNHSRDTENH